MKTKLEMAHDYLRDIVSNWEYDDSFDPVAEAWKYADAMQAEADKREKEDQEKLKQDDRNHHDALVEIGLEEWQPDWSKKTNEELRMLIKTLDGIIESRSDCNHEWDHISAYGGSGNYYVCSCGAEKHPMDDF